MFDLFGLSISNNHIGLALNNWLHKIADVFTGILVIAVSINNNIGTQRQRGMHAIVETARQALFAGVVHKVFDAQLFGYGDGVVGAAIVDDQYFYAINALNFLWYGL